MGSWGIWPWYTPGAPTEPPPEQEEHQQLPLFTHNPQPQQQQHPGGQDHQTGAQQQQQYQHQQQNHHHQHQQQHHQQNQQNQQQEGQQQAARAAPGAVGIPEEYPQHLNPFLGPQTLNSPSPPYAAHPQPQQHHAGQAQTFHTLPGHQLPAGRPPLDTPAIAPVLVPLVIDSLDFGSQGQGLPVLPSLPWSGTQRGPMDPSQQGLPLQGPMDPLLYSKGGPMGPKDPSQYAEGAIGPMGPLVSSPCDAGYEGGASNGGGSWRASPERGSESEGTPERDSSGGSGGSGSESGSGRGSGSGSERGSGSGAVSGPSVVRDESRSPEVISVPGTSSGRDTDSPGSSPDSNVGSDPSPELTTFSTDPSPELDTFSKEKISEAELVLSPMRRKGRKGRAVHVPAAARSHVEGGHVAGGHVAGGHMAGGHVAGGHVAAGQERGLLSDEAGMAGVAGGFVVAGGWEERGMERGNVERGESVGEGERSRGAYSDSREESRGQYSDTGAEEEEEDEEVPLLLFCRPCHKRDGTQTAKGGCALAVPICVIVTTILLSVLLALLLSTHLIIKPATSTTATQNTITNANTTNTTSGLQPPLGWFPPGVPGTGSAQSKGSNATHPGTLPNSSVPLPPLVPPPLPPPLRPLPSRPPHPPPPPRTVPLPLVAGRSNRPLRQVFNFTMLQKQNWEDRYLPCENHTDWNHRRVVMISGKAKGPTWRGWGTTLSWWARIVTHYTPEVYRQLMDLVFAPDKGLGLNMVRYQIPASYNASLSPLVTRSPLQSQGFRADPRAPYDWSQDARQKRVLVDAKAYGVDAFDAIAYSPPWWMTISGDVSGREGGKANFKSGFSGEYAQYLADVVDHFKRDPSLGVEFESVAPFNEALEGWWVAGRDKEGCGFRVDDVAAVTQDLVTALANRNVTAGIAVADCWTGTTQSFLTGGWTGQLAPEAQAAAARLSVHGYMTPAPDGQTWDRIAYVNLQQAAAALNKEIFQTEWGPLGYHGTELQLAVLLARVVCQHVNYLGVSAWYVWQVIQQKNGGGWGAIQVPGNVYRKEIRPVVLPKFYALKQLAAWVRPGSTPMVVEEACGSGFLAAYDGYRQYLSVTVVNQRFKPMPFSLNTTEYVPDDGAPRAWRRVDVFRTSGSENATLIDQYMMEVPGFIDMVSSGLTITTLVLHGVKPIG